MLMSTSPRFVVPTPGIRLDRFLSEQMPDYSRSEIQRWIKQGHVLVNGHPAKASHKLTARRYGRPSRART